MPFTGSYEEILRRLGNPQQGSYSNGVYIAPTSSQQVPGSYDPPGAGGSPLPTATTPYEQMARLLNNLVAGSLTPEQAAAELQAILAPLGQFTPQELPQVAAAWVEQAQRDGAESVMSVLAQDPGWRAALQAPDFVTGIPGLQPGGGGAGGGGGAAGTTPPGGGGTAGAGLPGAGEEDLLAEQPLGDQYMRFLLGQPQYQKGSGFLRGTAESKAGDLWNRWLLSQAENPQGFNFNAISGEAEAPQDWLGYLTGGAARPTRGQARGSLQNILGQLEAGTLPENPFGQVMWEQFGPDVEGGGENLRDLILQVTGMGIPSQLRGSFTRGARRRFEQQRVQQPGGRVQDWARQWGLL